MSKDNWLIAAGRWIWNKILYILIAIGLLAAGTVVYLNTGTYTSCAQCPNITIISPANDTNVTAGSIVYFAFDVNHSDYNITGIIFEVNRSSLRNKINYTNTSNLGTNATFNISYRLPNYEANPIFFRINATAWNGTNNISTITDWIRFYGIFQPDVHFCKGIRGFNFYLNSTEVFNQPANYQSDPQCIYNITNVDYANGNYSVWVNETLPAFYSLTISPNNNRSSALAITFTNTTGTAKQFYWNVTSRNSTLLWAWLSVNKTTEVWKGNLIFNFSAR